MLARQHQQGVHTYTVNIVPGFETPRKEPTSIQLVGGTGGSGALPPGPMSAHSDNIPAFSTGTSRSSLAADFDPAGPSSPMRTYAHSYPKSSSATTAMDTDADVAPSSSSSKKVRTVSADHVPAAESVPSPRYRAAGSASHSNAPVGVSIFSPRPASRSTRPHARSTTSHKRPLHSSRSDARSFSTHSNSFHRDSMAAPFSQGSVYQTLTAASSSSNCLTSSQMHRGPTSSTSSSSARASHARHSSTPCSVPPVPTYPWPDPASSSDELVPSVSSSSSISSMSSRRSLFGPSSHSMLGGSNSDPSFHSSNRKPAESHDHKRNTKSDSPPMFQSPTKRARKSLAGDAVPSSSALLRTPVASTTPSSPFATPSDASSVVDISPLAHPLSPLGAPQPPHASSLLAPHVHRQRRRTFSSEKPRPPRVLPQRQRSSPSVRSPTAPSSPKSSSAQSPDLYASRSMPSSPVASHRKRAPFAVPATPARRIRNPFASRSSRNAQAAPQTSHSFFSRPKFLSSYGSGGGTSTDEDADVSSSSQSNSFLANPFSALSSAFSLSRTSESHSHSSTSRRGSRPASPNTLVEDPFSFKQARIVGRASPFARRLFDEDGDEEMAAAASSSSMASSSFQLGGNGEVAPTTAVGSSLFVPLVDSGSQLQVTELHIDLLGRITSCSSHIYLKP